MVVIMAVTPIQVRRYSAPIGRCITVGRLVLLIGVLPVLLQQCIVFALQPAIVGSLVDERLLPCFIVELLRLVGLQQGFGLHLFLVGFEKIRVEHVQVM